MAPTIIITFQPSMDLNLYDRSLPQTSQDSSIPRAFLDCMTVREDVFVRGQNIPLLLEADADDPRCQHWVAYAISDDEEPVPVGTIRVVPFPQEEHPLPGSKLELPENPKVEDNKLAPEPRPWIVDRATTLHDGREPYLKLGRMAVVDVYRKYGIGKKLVDAAVEFAARHGNEVFSKKEANDEERGEVDEDMRTWTGLLCVHAQQSVVGFWERCGFVVDEGMGEWWEAEIPHVGMFRRVALA